MAHHDLECAGGTGFHKPTPLYGLAFWLGLAATLSATLSVLTCGLLAPLSLLGCVAGLAAVATTRGGSKAGWVGVVVNGLALVWFLSAFAGRW